MSEVKLNEYEVLNDLLLLQWGDGSENALHLKSQRIREEETIVIIKN